MALRGTLKDFGLSDIFQLISHQRKTGILYLEDKGKSVAVTFDEGKVVGAEPGSDRTQEKERVGDILVKSGLLDQRQLEDALQEQGRTMKKLGVILLEKRYLTQEVFQEALTFQIKETLFRLFQWSSGTYRFEAGKVSYDRHFTSALPAEYILMEAARIIDEWPGVQSRISSMDMVFSRLPGAEQKVVKRGELGVQEEEEDLDLDILGGGSKKPRSMDGDRIVLSASQERVFDLLNGQWTVREIAYRSLLGDFEASKTLVDLMGFGLVKPTKVPLSTPKAEEAVKTRRSYKGLLTMAAGVVLIGAVLLFLVNRMGSTGRGLAPFTQLTSDRAVAIRGSVSQAQIARLTLALETYRLEKGSYPQNMEELAQAGYIMLSDASYPYSHPYSIQYSDKGPVVVPSQE